MRRWTFKAKSARPGDVVVPRLLANGNLECPRCRNEASTPIEPNPYRAFQPEKMILVPNKMCQCPHCPALHLITPELALAHNHFWFGDDDQFMNPDWN